MREVWTSIVTLTNNGRTWPGFLYGQLVPGAFIKFRTTEIWAFYGDDENGYLGMKSQPLELNKKYTVLIKVYGTTATISVNGVIEDTQPVGPRSQLNNVEVYLGDPWNDPVDGIVSDISFGSVTPANCIVVDPPPLFSFKGPQQIEKSVDGEPAAVLSAPPTDYFLQFTIELKSISEYRTNIITLTNDGPLHDGQVFPDYFYGQLVPGVFVSPGTTQIVARYGDDENGHRSLYAQPLELNKKSTVLIKVYGTTATISVNGVIDNSQTVGPRAQLNNVELYIGDPWNYPADAIVSDISVGLV